MNSIYMNCARKNLAIKIAQKSCRLNKNKVLQKEN